jgi:uncharacterized membrane protein YccC
MRLRLPVIDTTRLSAALPDLGKGVRAAIVTLVPYYLAARLGRPELAWMALGGWLGTLADPGGARATRARALVVFAAAGLLVVAASEALASTAWLAVAWLTLVAFALSILRAAGGTAGSLGTLLTIAAAIASARARTEPLTDGLVFAAGALQAMILSSVVWPVWTHLPVRRAVAAVYHELGAYIGAVESATLARSPHGSEDWNELVREHHLRIRRAIESARTLALAVRERREGETRYGGNVRALLGAAEAQFPILSTLVQELEALPAEARLEPAKRLTRVLACEDDIERILTARRIRSRPTPPRRRGTIPPPDSQAIVHVLAARLEAASRDAIDLAHAIDEPVEAASEDAEAPFLAQARAGLRALADALSPRSVFFRHAVRTAGAALAGSIVGRVLAPAHAHWVTLTAIVILQPDPGATLKRASERVVGTVLGSVVAVAIIAAVHAPLVLSLLMVPLSILGVATRPRSYRLFTFFLTPVFVLLAERHPGDWWTAAERSGDALLGGVVALLGGVVIFPPSERALLPEVLAAMTDAVAAYARVVLAPPPVPRAPIAPARRASGLAISLAEASLERLLSEPRRDTTLAADAMLLVTYVRRLGTALTSVDTLAHVGATPLSRPDREAVAGYVTWSLARARAYVLAEAGADGEPPEPPELEGDSGTPLDAALARVVRWASLVAGIPHRS